MPRLARLDAPGVLHHIIIRRIQVAARSLLCYWAMRELGLAATEFAKQFKMTQPAVSYSVIPGRLIAIESIYTLVE
jgi:hypothetical protein